MASSPQLVTGGSGFVALELVQQLLEAGHTVHTTVRSLQNEAKTKPLKQLQGNHEGRLKLFEADLLKPGSFAAAMAGCSIVFHVASPFRVPEKIKNGQKEMVDPALEGTRNVLGSVNKTESVKRVVLTSTTGAIAGEYSDVFKMKDQVLSEAYFNESSTVSSNPYHYSKVIAEKEAWEIVKSQSRWDLVVICPGMIYGPTQAATSESGSLFLMDELLSGWMFYGVPDLCFLPVDVREVALAHVRAAKLPSAKGRYVVAQNEMISFLEISRTFKAVRKSMWLPNHQLPTSLVKIVGPLFGLTQSWMANHLGIRFTADNSRSVNELGIVYRPVEETLVDYYQSWASHHKSG